MAEAKKAETPHQQNVNITVNAHTQGVLTKNWTVALVLSVLLGWLGIDRFYLGSPGVGILKFFTLGLFGILWLVDIIMIATKSVKGIAWEE